MSSKELISITKCDVFTPEDISKLMAEQLSYNNENMYLLEPSVGTGNLLKFIDLNKYKQIHVFDIKKEYIQQIKSHKNMTKNVEDFLIANVEDKYDHIILNPPYIKIQDLPTSYREYIKENWPQMKGNIDIYYIFLLKSIELLKDDGIMVSITPNAYLYTKSAKNLRKYMIDNQFIKEIIDFKSKKVFKNISTYCCITVFTKSKKEFLIYNGEKIDYKNIKDYNLFETNTNKESNSLDDICIIKNGIATLRDKVYIHDKKLYDEPCWQPITNGKDSKWIIYPYQNSQIIKEEEFKLNNPNTYSYLQKNKEELASRDNGNKTYASWYAYGRTQSIVKPNSKEMIFIPTFNDPSNFKIYKRDSSLFISCIGIEIKQEHKNNISLDNIIQAITNNIPYIENNSSKRGGGWINVTTSVLKKINID